jgi:hypothetical protein
MKQYVEAFLVGGRKIFKQQCFPFERNPQQFFGKLASLGGQLGDRGAAPRPGLLDRNQLASPQKRARSPTSN